MFPSSALPFTLLTLAASALALPAAWDQPQNYQPTQTQGQPASCAAPSSCPTSTLGSFNGFNGPITNQVVLSNWYDCSPTAGKTLTSAIAYQCDFGQQGTPGSARTFPTKDKWLSFEAMWALNLNNIKVGVDKDALKAAILCTAYSTKVDARIIFAIIINETNGDGTKCNDWAPEHCGVMQAAAGSHKVVSGGFSIMDSIHEGVLGVPVDPQGKNGGAGLAYLLEKAATEETGWFRQTMNPDGSDNGNPFSAARQYTSGSIPNHPSLNVGSEAPTAYVLDIANRLVGWADLSNTRASC